MSKFPQLKIVRTWVTSDGKAFEDESVAKAAQESLDKRHRLHTAFEGGLSVWSCIVSACQSFTQNDLGVDLRTARQYLTRVSKGSKAGGFELVGFPDISVVLVKDDIGEFRVSLSWLVSHLKNDEKNLAVANDLFRQGHPISVCLSEAFGVKPAYPLTNIDKDSELKYQNGFQARLVSFVSPTAMETIGGNSELKCRKGFSGPAGSFVSTTARETIGEDELRGKLDLTTIQDRVREGSIRLLNTRSHRESTGAYRKLETANKMLQDGESLSLCLLEMGIETTGLSGINKYSDLYIQSRGCSGYKPVEIMKSGAVRLVHRRLCAILAQTWELSLAAEHEGSTLLTREEGRAEKMFQAGESLAVCAEVLGVKLPDGELRLMAQTINKDSVFTYLEHEYTQRMKMTGVSRKSVTVVHPGTSKVPYPTPFELTWSQFFLGLRGLIDADSVTTEDKLPPHEHWFSSALLRNLCKTGSDEHLQSVLVRIAQELFDRLPRSD